MGSDSDETQPLGRIVALATLVWYYEEQVKYMQGKSESKVEHIATIYDKKIHALRELEKIVNIPFINEHPIGADDA